MIDSSMLDKMDFHLIRVLHTVLTERSVSRAALILGMHQPAVSLALKRLRKIAGDPLLVRAGTIMVPTEVGLRMIAPSADILHAAETLFANARGFDPATETNTFRIAASDYLGPQLLPALVSRIRAQAPRATVEIRPLIDRVESYRQLAQGEIDVVLISWFEPTSGLLGAPLFDDEVACMVSSQHPAVREGWTIESWLACEHVLPLPVSIYSRSLIDQHLDRLGLTRNCVVWCPYFNLIPDMVAQSALVVTGGRRFFARFVDRLPLTVLPCPVEFPRMVHHQVWHQRSDSSGAGRWLREQVHEAAADLRNV
jgi:DNA-binding transcriptional LysR family regulator